MLAAASCANNSLLVTNYYFLRFTIGVLFWKDGLNFIALKLYSHGKKKHRCQKSVKMPYLWSLFSKFMKSDSMVRFWSNYVTKHQNEYTGMCFWKLCQVWAAAHEVAIRTTNNNLFLLYVLGISSTHNDWWFRYFCFCSAYKNNIFYWLQ